MHPKVHRMRDEQRAVLGDSARPKSTATGARQTMRDGTVIVPGKPSGRSVRRAAAGDATSRRSGRAS